MNLVRNISVLGLVGAALLAGVGCSSAAADDGSEGDETTGAATPGQNDIVFEQVKTCDNLIKDRAAFRDADLQEGVLRWKCGDVPGVSISACEDKLRQLADEEMTGVKTLSDADRTKLTQDESTRKVDVVQARRNTLRACGEGFGQEYCEYNAVSKGNVVNAVKSAAKMGAADTVQCVFTSVHSDFQGTLADPEKIADSFSTQLKPQLVSAERVPEGRVSAMKQGVNSRGAADTLISDCANLAKDTKLAKNAERQVQCYNLWVKSPSAAEKVRWEKACKSIDLSDDAAWAKSGVKEAALSDADRDLAACTMVLKAQHGGVSWRNSDPSICGRSYRAAHECNVTFKGIGEVAPQFPGFSMQGWTNRDTIPGCTSAKIGDALSKNVVICNANPQDVKTYRAQKRPLQTLCRDKFGDQVAMQAPIGLLANLGDAKEETPFCKAFVAGAKHAQSPTPAGKQ